MPGVGLVSMETALPRGRCLVVVATNRFASGHYMYCIYICMWYRVLLLWPTAGGLLANMCPLFDERASSPKGILFR